MIITQRGAEKTQRFAEIRRVFIFSLA